MKSEANLPFEVGDLAEARTFEEGFRGAWFRCKIIEIITGEGRLVLLDYYDFPGEDLEWIGVYQVPPYPLEDAKGKHRELMIRPSYPPICNKKQMLHASEISEVTVVVDNSWKVGDLVDWCSHDCYWSGRIIQLLGDDRAKIELKPPPLGEGSDYDVFLKDVRPSLDWSPEHGWTVPTQGGGHPCAQLMKPVNQVGRIQNSLKTDAVVGSTGSSARLSNSAVSGEVSTRTTEMLKQPLVSEEEEKCTSRKSKTSGDVESNRSHECRGSEGFPLKLDTADAAVMVLEEYVNKVEWLKHILKYGISSSDAERPPQWEFEETK
ncbi:hypothetical protein ACS0TY_014378 [Phlomoides rotata]